MKLRNMEDWILASKIQEILESYEKTGSIKDIGKLLVLVAEGVRRNLMR